MCKKRYSDKNHVWSPKNLKIRIETSVVMADEGDSCNGIACCSRKTKKMMAILGGYIQWLNPARTREGDD